MAAGTISRVATALVCALTLLVALTPPAALAEAVGGRGLHELNRYRLVAGVPPVTLTPGGAAQLHARYLALNEGRPEVAGLRSHEEVPGLPGYTPEGAAVAARSNIARGSATAEEAVRGLVDVPLHRHWMLDPMLASIGFGGENLQWVVDLSDSRPVRGTPQVVAFPGPGQGRVPTHFPGNENPNPLTAIPGIAPDAAVGYPISLHFFGCMPGAAVVTLTSGGAPVPVHVMQPGTVIQGTGGERALPFVLVFPQEPLLPDTAYLVTANVGCGALGERTYTWPFSTTSAFRPDATGVALTAPNAAGQQTLTLQFVDGKGAPVEGVQLRRWTTRFQWGPARATNPRLAYGGASGPNGRMASTFMLNDAARADLELGVEHDGRSATVRVSVTGAASGQLRTLPPAGEFPLDMVARAEWEAAHAPVLPLLLAKPGGDSLMPAASSLRESAAAPAEIALLAGDAQMTPAGSALVDDSLS